MTTDDTPTETIGEYEGRAIDAYALAIRGLGGGLDDPLAIEGEHIPIGGKRMVCVPVVVVEHTPKVKDRKDPDEGALTLVHIAIGDGPLFFIDPTVVEQARGEHLTKVMLAQKALDDAKEREAKAKKGTGAQPVATAQTALGVDKDALRQQHLSDDPELNHSSGKVAGCAECEWEDDEEAREQQLEADAELDNA